MTGSHSTSLLHTLPEGCVGVESSPRPLGIEGQVIVMVQFEAPEDSRYLKISWALDQGPVMSGQLISACCDTSEQTKNDLDAQRFLGQVRKEAHRNSVLAPHLYR